MTAIIKTVNLKECPKLASWIEDEEGLLGAYINEMQCTIPALLSIQANMEGSEPSEEFKAIGRAARLLGCLANDMAVLRKELFP